MWENESGLLLARNCIGSAAARVVRRERTRRCITGPESTAGCRRDEALASIGRSRTDPRCIFSNNRFARFAPDCIQPIWLAKPQLLCVWRLSPHLGLLSSGTEVRNVRIFSGGSAAELFPHPADWLGGPTWRKCSPRFVHRITVPELLATSRPCPYVRRFLAPFAENDLPEEVPRVRSIISAVRPAAFSQCIITVFRAASALPRRIAAIIRRCSSAEGS